uniref:Type II toxin-antitoxin system PemK/MazF family toxin n=1 Tax=Steinernema glaseri TaxID=37863 RepID=A0A1I7YTX5_9BILA
MTRKNGRMDAAVDWLLWLDHSSKYLYESSEVTFRADNLARLVPKWVPRWISEETYVQWFLFGRTTFPMKDRGRGTKGRKIGIVINNDESKRRVCFLDVNREVTHIRKPSLIICLRNARLYKDHVRSIEALQSGNAGDETKRIAEYIKDICEKSVDILENKMSTDNPTVGKIKDYFKFDL